MGRLEQRDNRREEVRHRVRRDDEDLDDQDEDDDDPDDDGGDLGDQDGDDDGSMSKGVQLTEARLYRRIGGIVRRAVEPVYTRLDAIESDHEELRKAIDDNTSALDDRNEILEKIEKGLSSIDETRVLLKGIEEKGLLAAASQADASEGSKTDATTAEVIQKGDVGAPDLKPNTSALDTALYKRADGLLEKGMEAARKGKLIAGVQRVNERLQYGELDKDSVNELEKALKEAGEL